MFLNDKFSCYKKNRRIYFLMNDKGNDNLIQYVYSVHKVLNIVINNRTIVAFVIIRAAEKKIAFTSVHVSCSIIICFNNDHTVLMHLSRNKKKYLTSAIKLCEAKYMINWEQFTYTLNDAVCSIK